MNANSSSFPTFAFAYFHYFATFIIWILLPPFLSFCTASSAYAPPPPQTAQLNTGRQQWKYVQFDAGHAGHGGDGSKDGGGKRRVEDVMKSIKYEDTNTHTSNAVGAESAAVRPARQLNLSPLNSLGLQGQTASVAITDYGHPNVDLDFGGYAAAGSHGGGGGGYGSGYGGGGYGGHGHGKQDCNSALGLLGVLGLLSFLQSVLQQLTSTTAAPAGRRRKRDESTHNWAQD